MTLLETKMDTSKNLGYLVLGFKDGSIKEYTVLEKDLEQINKKNVFYKFKNDLKRNYLQVRTLRHPRYR